MEKHPLSLWKRLLECKDQEAVSNSMWEDLQKIAKRIVAIDFTRGNASKGKRGCESEWGKQLLQALGFTDLQQLRSYETNVAEKLQEYLGNIEEAKKNHEGKVYTMFLGEKDAAIQGNHDLS